MELTINHEVWLLWLQNIIHVWLTWIIEKSIDRCMLELYAWHEL